MRKGRDVYCLKCGLRKKPLGRDAPAADPSGCTPSVCSDYYKDPIPDILWPGEEKCQICGHKPRQFDLFGGGYWRTLGSEHWICPICFHWATKILG